MKLPLHQTLLLSAALSSVDGFSSLSSHGPPTASALRTAADTSRIFVVMPGTSTMPADVVPLVCITSSPKIPLLQEPTPAAARRLVSGRCCPTRRNGSPPRWNVPIARLHRVVQPVRTHTAERRLATSARRCRTSRPSWPVPSVASRMPGRLERPMAASRSTSWPSEVRNLT